MNDLRWMLRHPGDMFKDEIISIIVKRHGFCSILDIGCGMGHTSLLLSKLGRVVGIDLSCEDVKVASKMVSGDFICADASQLPFKGDVFEYIVIKDVLEHLKDDGQCINEAYRILKNHGKMIVSVPYSLDKGVSAETLVKKLTGYTTDSYFEHLRRYSDDFPHKLKTYGFKINETFYFAHFIFSMITLLVGVYFWAHHQKKANLASYTPAGTKGLLTIITTVLQFLKRLGYIEFKVARKLKGACVFLVATKELNG